MMRRLGVSARQRPALQGLLSSKPWLTLHACAIFTTTWHLDWLPNAADPVCTQPAVTLQAPSRAPARAPHRAARAGLGRALERGPGALRERPRRGVHLRIAVRDRVHVLADQPHKVLAGRHRARDQEEQLPCACAAGRAVAAALLQQLHVQLVLQLRLLDALPRTPRTRGQRRRVQRDRVQATSGSSLSLLGGARRPRPARTASGARCRGAPPPRRRSAAACPRQPRLCLQLRAKMLAQHAERALQASEAGDCVMLRAVLAAPHVYQRVRHT